MDERAIGVFDSGLGGLTAVRELRKILPGEDIVFFGDTGRVPYGSRSPEVIRKYAAECLHFLEKQNVKIIIVACGTVSSVFGDDLQNTFSVPCMGVVEPAVKAAVSATKNGKIGLIATAATVASRSYEKLAAKLLPDAEFTAKACPLFVPLVENGYFGADCEVTRLVAKDYLAAFDGKDIDTLILGCTHYPFASHTISRILGGQVDILDGGDGTARETRRRLAEKDLLRLADLLGHSSINTTRIYTMETGRQHMKLLERVSRVLLT